MRRTSALAAVGLLASIPSLLTGCDSDGADALAACEEGDPTCPDGPKLVGNDVCNHFTRSLEIDDTRVTWGTYWLSTMVDCRGGLADTLSNFFNDESFLYIVTGDLLRLTSSSGAIELTLRASS